MFLGVGGMPFGVFLFVFFPPYGSARYCTGCGSNHGAFSAAYHGPGGGATGPANYGAFGFFTPAFFLFFLYLLCFYFLGHTGAQQKNRAKHEQRYL